MDHYDKANRVVGNLIRGGKREFAIYPFGRLGMQLKEILNQRYGIKEKYIIDNRLAEISENNCIINLEQFEKVNTHNITVLLASDSENIYSEIRSQLFKYIDMERIVDIYSYSAYYDREVLKDPIIDVPDIRVAALNAVANEIYYHNVNGAIAECGVYKGEFSKWMNRFMPDRKLYLFDTFEGFPKNDITDDELEKSSWLARGAEDYFKDTSVETVLNNIGKHVNVILRKGYFPETAKGLEDEKFAFVNLDTDLYAPILAGLEFFYPRLNPGGYIFVHDYRIELFGVRQAVEEFCKKREISIVCLPDKCGTAVLAKPM